MKKQEKISINSFKDYTKLNSTQKNQLARQYEPLVNKITKQFQEKTRIEWNTLKSMAYEGLSLAFNTYDSKKSNMKFLSYAAFAIRNNILTSMDNEIRTVKLSNYAQKKALSRGETLFNSTSLDSLSSKPSSDDESFPKEYKYDLYEKDKFSNGNPYEYLYSRLGVKFPNRDLEMFYKSFGLHSFDMMKNKDIAKEYGVSEGLVSQKNKKIIEYIRKDQDLCEMLGEL
jgi:RNA polymerase sigma factor (sigma-70 family)